MDDFKGRHFRGKIILLCVRWYCKYGISYRELEEMMKERGVNVDHPTIYRRFQKYAPEIEARLRWYWKPKLAYSWRVDEYVKVKGKWVYLYRAVNKRGQTIDFYLSRTRSTKAAKLFLGKALRNINKSVHPRRINTDKAPTYPSAISQLKALGKAKPDLEHRRVKYLNNVIEADHGKLKRLIKPTLGFKSMKTAYATIKGFEVMLAIKKGQCRPFVFKNDIMTEVRLINQQFGLFSI